MISIGVFADTAALKKDVIRDGLAFHIITLTEARNQGPWSAISSSSLLAGLICGTSLSFDYADL